MKKIVLTLLFITTLFGAGKIYKGDISTVELESMIATGAVVIDIRTPPEWKHLGVIKGSKKITFFDERGRYSIDKFVNSLKNEGVSKEDRVVIICRTGNRSITASNLLTTKGFRNVYNVTKGIKGWIRSGKRTEKNLY